MEEIRKVVFSLEGGDAVDLDGFIMAFFQENWELIKEDIDEVLSEFHKCGIITSSLNETCVIPKRRLHIELRMLHLLVLSPTYVR